MSTVRAQGVSGSLRESQEGSGRNRQMGCMLGAELIGAQPAKLANQSLVTKYTHNPPGLTCNPSTIQQKLVSTGSVRGPWDTVLLGVPGGIQWGLDQGSSALTRAQAEHRLIPLGFLR